jgi:hypothetical protein
MANPIRFAFTPAVAIIGIIDYSTIEGRKLYGHATSKLDEELYDRKPDGLYQFLQSLNNCAQKYGWNEIRGILNIPQDPQDINSETNYLINNYGMILLSEIRGLKRLISIHQFGQPKIM